MPWEKSSPDLVDLFQRLVPDAPNVQRKQMFGYPCAFVNGNLFTGLFKQGMLFRLDTPDQRAFLDLQDTAYFEPMPGRKMTGYVICDDPFCAGEEVMGNWMKCALAFASKLPPKKKSTEDED
jgi:hypothetical protein